MKLEEVTLELENNANPSRRKSFMKAGAPDTSLGVPMGVLRKLAKEIQIDHDLAVELWKTGVPDARLLAVQLFDTKKTRYDEAMELITSADFEQLSDELVSKFIVKLDDVEHIKETVKHDTRDAMQRVYWALEVDMIAHEKGLTRAYFDALLEVIEAKLQDSPETVKWMMNRALCEIGFRYEDYTKRCIDLGERLGVYKEMVVAPGCTSAYAPEWIGAVIKRKPPKTRSIS